MSKPEPIRVGVSGFVAFEAKPNAPAHHIDWDRLAGLPAFQMYLAETGMKPEPSDALYSAYCAWHSSKGYWPNETPMGELMPGFDPQGTN